MSRTFIAFLAAALVVVLPRHAAAQIDIAGEWASRIHEDLNHRSPGPALGDYGGLPLNDAGRQKATSWDASILSSPEEQAKPHPAQYHMRGPGTNLRIQKVIDPYDQHLIAYTITGLYGRADRIIWMDGRPHPSPYAEHLWQGFSTGQVVDNKLVVTTTHMKTGVIQRNGGAASYKSTMTEYFVRHGDILTMTSFVEDPAYLEEPFVRTSTWVLTPNLGIDTRMLMEVVEELADRPKDYVPSYPLGTKHEEFAKNFGIPFEATQGGSETLYPDYLPKLRAMIKGEKPQASAKFVIPGTVPAALLAPPPVHQEDKVGDIEVLQVRPNIYMLIGAGAHVTVQTGSDGVLVVDAGSESMTEPLLAAIRKISTAPIRYLVLTHVHPESTGGTIKIVEAGGPRTNATGARSTPANIDSGVATIAHENVNQRLSLAKDLQEESLPTSTFYSERKDIFFNGEAIELLSVPKAHTDGDILVFFRKSDVVSAGGLLDTTRYPMIDAETGGSLQGVINGLTKMIDLTVPERNQMGGTVVVPGHGRLCNEADIVEYRNMVVIVRDRIRDMVKKGLTLEQVKAARPTLDYDALYGSTTGSWTTDMFINEVYKELSATTRATQ